MSSEPVDDLDAALNSLKGKIEEQATTESDTQEETSSEESTDDEATTSDSDSVDDVPEESVETESDDESDAREPEEPKLSRRQRAKLYEEFKAKADEERVKNEALQAELDQRKEEDSKREAAITKALGTNEDYQQALEDMQSSDPKVSEPAKKKFKIYTANRKFFGDLQTMAERDVNTKLARDYWAAADERPGIDKEFIATNPMKDVMLHFYDQGASHAEAAASVREDKLNKTIETLRGELSELRGKKVSEKASPVNGGKPVTKDNGGLRTALGADGLPTDEAITNARNGKLDWLK